MTPSAHSAHSILLAGESWTSTATHIKGFDQFPTVTYHNGAKLFLDALKDSRYTIRHMPSHEAQEDFPSTLEGLLTPNRLKLLREYVAAGGGLMMVGGYLSFQGINGSARFRGTPVEEVLPVTCLPYDDRVEVPEGFTPQVVAAHPLVDGLGTAWPHLLGYNEVQLKPDATLIATVPETGHPLLVAGTYGKGRTLAWTSDMSHHWLPPEFSDWDGNARLWLNCLDWLSSGGE